MVMIPNQIVEVTWGSKNKKWFEEKGYLYNGIGQKFKVRAEDLMLNSSVRVEYECDKGECKNKFIKRYHDINVTLEKSNRILCKDCSYQERSQNTINKHKVNQSNYNEVELFDKILNKENNRFPDGFVQNITINQAKNIVLHLIEYLIKNNYIKNMNEAKCFLTQKNFVKFHIGSIADRFGINTLLKEVFEGSYEPWEYNMVDDGYWENYEHTKNAFYWFMNKLIEDGTIESIDNLPKISYHKKLREYQISGMVKRFNGSFSELAVFVDPDRFKKWFFNVPKNYYKNDENIKEMMNWFIGKLFEDKVVTQIDDIPLIANRNIFERYKLGSMLAHCFQLSPYNAMNFMYPNRWKRWEFKHVPNDFWNEPSNLRDALIWFIEQLIRDKIISDVSEITNHNINKLLSKYKLTTLVAKYDIPFMLTMIYGKQIKYTSYYKRISDIDDTKLDSIEEKQVHDILLRNFQRVYKPKNRNSSEFKNKNESYLPDWIINDELIVEYFGLYLEKPETDYMKNYKKKTHRKIKYYNKLKKYNFVPLFPDDLHNNYKGLKSKFKEININIVV
ncbi:hypothetical protein [Robertmurraya siralis]|uniref:hypothetical protein n=1 Tax=Robertmurraya siralis TaxID=77777 RepID=UPI0010F69579|nr:hypothetical protein [Robertmurraya siralis]